MNETVIGITILFLLLAYFLTGIELAFGMAIMGFVGYAMIMSLSAAMNLLAKDFFDSVSSYGLTVIPLFVLMGQIAFNAGIAGRLYDSAHKFLGDWPLRQWQEQPALRLSAGLPLQRQLPLPA